MFLILRFSSQYIVEYIHSFFFLGNKGEMAVAYCRTWSSGTLYMSVCVENVYMEMAGCVCGLAALFCSQLEYILAFFYCAY